MLLYGLLRLDERSQPLLTVAYIFHKLHNPDAQVAQGVDIVEMAMSICLSMVQMEISQLLHTLPKDLVHTFMVTRG